MLQGFTHIQVYLHDSNLLFSQFLLIQLLCLLTFPLDFLFYSQVVEIFVDNYSVYSNKYIIIIKNWLVFRNAVDHIKNFDNDDAGCNGSSLQHSCTGLGCPLLISHLFFQVLAATFLRCFWLGFHFFF